MPFLFLAAFIVVPILEIAVLIQVGSQIGVLATIAIVLLTAILGTYLLRRQGLQVLDKAQRAIAEGRAPLDTVRDGVCLLVAGTLLLTPGFLTDAAGLLLFIPVVRQWIAARFVEHFLSRATVTSYSSTTGTDGSRRTFWSRRSPDGARTSAKATSTSRPDLGGKTIDGDYRDITPDNDRTDAKTHGPRSSTQSSPWRGPPGSKS